MTLIKNVILALIGVSSGVAVAAGIFAFITMLGVVERLASRTHTSNHILLYEDCVLIGGTLGNLIAVYKWDLPIGHVGMLLFGLFAGMFVGCLAMALAEELKVMPIFSRRIKLTQGMPIIVLCIAIGKCIGSLLQLYFLR